MAEEGLLDKAMGLIPGVNKRKPVTRRRDAKEQLALLQTSLAKLARDVEKLGRLIRRDQARSSPRGRTRPAAKRSSARRSTTRRKSAGAAQG